MPTWQTLPWDTVRTTADLLSLCAQQLEKRDEDIEAALLRIRRLRIRGKEYFDNTHAIRDGEFKVGILVLLYNTKLEKRYNVKLDFRWKGLYRIAVAIPDKGTYELEELDGSRLRGTMPGRRLKRFIQRAPQGERDPVEAPELLAALSIPNSPAILLVSRIYKVAIPRADINRDVYKSLKKVDKED